MEWTDTQIKELFDSSQITLSRLSTITGKSITDLKAILMPGFEGIA